ncbi:MAG: hypothetical protein K0Q57_1071 [Gammaproteobacteria bacterium]|jgi:hypothetical protein|nr:hypothetical protein [Gammaproteobacteria bacterium]
MRLFTAARSRNTTEFDTVLDEFKAGPKQDFLNELKLISGGITVLHELAYKPARLAKLLNLMKQTLSFGEIEEILKLRIYPNAFNAIRSAGAYTMLFRIIYSDLDRKLIVAAANGGDALKNTLSELSLSNHETILRELSFQNRHQDSPLHLVLRDYNSFCMILNFMNEHLSEQEAGEIIGLRNAQNLSIEDIAMKPENTALKTALARSIAMSGYNSLYTDSWLPTLAEHNPKAYVKTISKTNKNPQNDRATYKPEVKVLNGFIRTYRYFVDNDSFSGGRFEDFAALIKELFSSPINQPMQILQLWRNAHPIRHGWISDRYNKHRDALIGLCNLCSAEEFRKGAYLFRYYLYVRNYVYESETTGDTPEGRVQAALDKKGLAQFINAVPPGWESFRTIEANQHQASAAPSQLVFVTGTGRAQVGVVAASSKSEPAASI